MNCDAGGRLMSVQTNWGSTAEYVLKPTCGPKESNIGASNLQTKYLPRAWNATALGHDCSYSRGQGGATLARPISYPNNLARVNSPMALNL
jgi:hypothetical protein